jgi:hypothetical protein
VVCLRVATCLGAWLALFYHWGDLGGFVRELASIKYPFASAIACFKALSALPVCDMSGLKCLYIAMSPNFREKNASPEPLAHLNAPFNKILLVRCMKRLKTSSVWDGDFEKCEQGPQFRKKNRLPSYFNVEVEDTAFRPI